MLKEYFSIAFRSVITHKVRALLTMLGVIIGVSSVIILLSLGASTKAEAARQIRGLGSNLIMVRVSQSENYLSKIWLDELKNSAKFSAYSPVVNGNVSYRVGASDFDVTINGVNQYFEFISNLSFSSGRFFTESDVKNKVAVVAIGKKVAEKLFPNENPIGKQLSIKGIPFKVAGVLKERGMSFNGDLDLNVYIPSDFANSLFPNQRYKILYIASQNEDTAETTKTKIEGYLNKKMPSTNMYMVFSQSQMLDMLNQIMGLLTTLLACIAGISLVVGGIGIMNIMLVTVRERTKEIGIRKALGAMRSNILLQFLIEAIIITALGGLIGLGLSFLITKIIESVANFPVRVGLDSVALSIIFSITIGLIFGIYPANKASKLEPVEALRFE
jgi:putative ABC transport system permease protein